MIDGPKLRAAQRRDAWKAAARRAYGATSAGPMACRQGFVLTHQQSREAGVSTRQSRRFVSRGEWTAPRPGVLSVLPFADESSFVNGRRPEVRAAAVALVRRETVISHECAALAAGLEVLETPSLATLSAGSRARATSRAGAVVRAAELGDDEITSWYGVPMTTVVRTVIDIARRGLRPGIVVADSALAAGLITLDDLRLGVERARRWDGVVTARRVLELATPYSESVLESLTRLFLASNHVPLPEPQQWIETCYGRYRVDGLWPDKRVVLEADGLQKYRTKGAWPAEKRREGALELAGYKVVRVTWADIHDEPRLTLRRIWAALA